MSEGVRESGEVPESVINALRISRMQHTLHAAYTAKGEVDAMYSNLHLVTRELYTANAVQSFEIIVYLLDVYRIVYMSKVSYR